ncbi:MAG: cytochrome c biogenesis protein CcsA [Gammaproteobacteria bacterium]|nr:cytochrome c biogenesis protein CcsA [Gammaproteobacteria bacterium]
MPELSVTAGIFAASFYGLAFALQLRRLRGGGNTRPLVLGCGLVAVLAHAVSAWEIVRLPDGYHFGITQISTLIALAISLLVLGSSLRKPLDNLFLGLFPLAIATILLSLTTGSNFPSTSLDPASGGHVLLSVLAYGFISIAALQAVFLSWQNHQLKHGHAGGLLARMPPLQDMEAFLLELLWAGEILLSLAIVTGVFFIDDAWSMDGIIHKSFFTALAWLLFAVLLWGHHRLGWRGTTMIRGTLTGFVLLVVGFYGSKFVLEYVLG